MKGFTVEPQIFKPMLIIMTNIFKADFWWQYIKKIWTAGLMMINTDGMIEKIVDKISADSVMYLVNAIAFDAEWQNIYEKSGAGRCVLRWKTELQKYRTDVFKRIHYLEDENATGFIKCYTDRKYALLAHSFA